MENNENSNPINEKSPNENKYSNGLESTATSPTSNEQDHSDVESIEDSPELQQLARRDWELESNHSIPLSEFDDSDREDFDIEDWNNLDLQIEEPVKLRQLVLENIAQFKQAFAYLTAQIENKDTLPFVANLSDSLQALETKLADIYEELFQRHSSIEEARKAAQLMHKKLSQKALALELGTNKLQYSIDVLKEKLVETEEASRAFDNKLKSFQIS